MAQAVGISNRDSSEVLQEYNRVPAYVNGWHSIVTTVIVSSLIDLDVWRDGTCSWPLTGSDQHLGLSVTGLPVSCGLKFTWSTSYCNNDNNCHFSRNCLFVCLLNILHLNLGLFIFCLMYFWPF